MSDPITIGIDAGHGGRNLGTRWGDLVEAALTLRLANECAVVMARSKTALPYLIRSEDIDLSHDERAGIARRAGCAAVVSLHYNWSDVRSRSGCELYFHRKDPDGRALGVEILHHVSGRSDWKAWPADMRYNGEIACPGANAVVSAYHEAGIPVALIEVGFISSHLDRARIGMAMWDNTIACAVRSGSESWAAGAWRTK